MMRAQDAARRFEQARSIYQSAGYTSGERDMRFALPMVLVEVGRFSEAATAFDPLLAEIDQITDQELRVDSYLAAGRAQSMSDRIDEGLSLLLKALPLSREYQLRTQEATALESIGYIYHNCGDLQQAIAFYDEALKIMRTQKDTTEYSFALQSAANVARTNGDLDLAFKLAKTSLRVSSTPIARARNHHELASYYLLKENLPAAIADTCRPGGRPRRPASSRAHRWKDAACPDSHGPRQQHAEGSCRGRKSDRRSLGNQ